MGDVIQLADWDCELHFASLLATEPLAFEAVVIVVFDSPVGNPPVSPRVSVDQAGQDVLVGRPGSGWSELKTDEPMDELARLRTRSR